MGIDPALLPDVFEMFVQGARGPDRAQGGLGLGLVAGADADRAARRHGERAQRRARPRQRVHGAAAGVAHRRRAFARAPARLARPARVASARASASWSWTTTATRAEMISRPCCASAGHEVQIANDPSQALAMADDVSPAGRDPRHRAAGDGRLRARARAARAPGRRRADADRAHRLRPGRRTSGAARRPGFALHLVKPVDAEMLVHLLDALVG